MKTRAYQCSRCELLYDADEHCGCLAGIDPRTDHREKGDAELCHKNFEMLPEEDQWHAKFPWEN